MDRNILLKKYNSIYLSKIVITLVFIVTVYAFYGCKPGFVPKEAQKRWGFKQTEHNLNYEKSLSYNEVLNDDINPKNHWRVLNYMMYYLLQKKAQGQFNSQAESYLNQLNTKNEKEILHFMYDSARVAQIYERAFISENIKLERETPNDFIYKHLAEEILPQVLSLGGFEQVMGLNEWGKKIVEAGPFKDIRKGINYIEAVSVSNGFTYRATENPETFELFISYIGIGSSDDLDSPIDPITGKKAHGPEMGKYLAEMESKLLRKEEERKVYIPIDYDKSFKITQMGLVKLPCQNNDALWINNPDPKKRQSFFNGVWDGNRIIIDVSADVSTFVDSKGIAEFDLRYLITGLNGSSVKLTDQTVHIKDYVGTKGGFIKRVITEAFPSYDSCNVSVILTNGEKALRYDSLIILESGYFPLEIISKDIKGIGYSGIPFFNIGSIKEGENYQLFLPINGLSKNYDDSVYLGFVNIYLTLSKKQKSSVRLDKDFTWEWADSVKEEEKKYTTREQVTLMYGDKLLNSFDLKSKYAGGYFIVDLKIPKVSHPMEKYDIVAEFYKFLDPKSKSVEKIGEAYKTITIK